VDSVLFLETEDPAWMVEARIRGLAKGQHIEKDDVPGFHYACVGPFDFLGKDNRIEELVQKHTPKFTVLSTLQNLLHGKDYNRQDDMQPVMAGMIKLARLSPLFLVTHSPWDRRQKRAAGTVTQTANFVTAIHYEKKIARKTGMTFVHVSVDSKAGALETDFSLKLETNGRMAMDGTERQETCDPWLQRLRRTEEALARFYVAHRRSGCTAPDCELCREFFEGVKAGLNIDRLGEKPAFPSWMKILEEAGYAETVKF
jgi:hypothetical protein